MQPDELQMLLEGARRFVARHSGPDDATTSAAGDAALWAGITELGWPMLPFAESDGGMGADLAAVAALLEVLGEGPLRAPYLEQVVLAGGLVAAAPPSTLRSELVAGVMNGHLRLAAALYEPRHRHDLMRCRTAARPCDRGYLITGDKALVLGGTSADRLVVLARTVLPGDRGQGQHGLFVVDTRGPGVTTRPVALRDGTWASDVTLQEVLVEPDAVLCAPGAADATLARALNVTLTGASAAAVGSMSRLVTMSVAYTAGRKQFGRPIAAFQVIQHQLVDMQRALEASRGLVAQAVAAGVSGDATRFSATARAAKAAIGEHALYIGKAAIQVHGAMGISEDLPVGRYVRRLVAFNLLLGDPHFHRTGQWPGVVTA